VSASDAAYRFSVPQGRGRVVRAGVPLVA
jgi:hypothetical protein